MSSNTSIAEKEKTFQERLKEYRETGSKSAWDDIYFLIYDCCHNLCAKMLVGVKLDPDKFNDRVMDSTLYVMKRIKQGLNPGKLSSYCYLVCKGRIHGPKVQFEDMNITYVNDFFQEVQYDAT